MHLIFKMRVPGAEYLLAFLDDLLDLIAVIQSDVFVIVVLATEEVAELFFVVVEVLQYFEMYFLCV